MELFDLVVIGGGIHGCGVAADAAGRGLKVALFEKADLGAGTSSASTKLIHGGLRYLESYEFSLVRQCLMEQRLLLQNAGYLVQPLPFVIPVDNNTRPLWMINLGLFFYDRLTARSMPHSTILSAQDLEKLELQKKPKAAFRYYDCQTDDNRLVIADALLATSLGAKIYTHHEVTSVVSTEESWIVKTQGKFGPYFVKAKAIANMTGPWLKNVTQDCQLITSQTEVKLVQGAHLIVPKLYSGPDALAYQHDDGRLVFFVPYLEKFTLVGTTEFVIDKMPQKPTIDPCELTYLKDLVSKVFGKNIKDNDIIGHYAGVRALIDSNKSASKATRDYKVEKMYCPHHKHPIVHLIGGKITTWRLSAEDIVSSLKKEFPLMTAPWTTKKILPGARVNTSSHMIFEELCRDFPFINKELLKRWSQTYGLRTYNLIGLRSSLKEFGAKIADNLYEAEIDFLMSTEWAQNLDDILFRRTKLGLTLSPPEVKLIYDWFGQPITHQIS
ncbi:glycerol-3-phosphate dehydrogenase [bacterium]|nr:glycerol-3-phosphate dehydrogenase [bacterium]NBW56652.1 glycerol-3-phosphate dehydrogenase [bacterium]NBX72058.1 glycerol-3-phosphate dehydrogenase [bacterium]